MSEYDGLYIRLAHNPAYYAVDNGKKRLVKSPEHMSEIGLRRVIVVLESEFEAIPFVGESDEEE